MIVFPDHCTANSTLFSLETEQDCAMVEIVYLFCALEYSSPHKNCSQCSTVLNCFEKKLATGSPESCHQNVTPIILRLPKCSVVSSCSLVLAQMLMRSAPAIALYRSIGSHAHDTHCRECDRNRNNLNHFHNSRSSHIGLCECCP